MKKLNSIRVIFYVVLFALSLALIQIKKNQIVHERTRDVVSIPQEVQKHGTPVDLEKVEVQQMFDTYRVTVEPMSSQSQEMSFLLGRSDLGQIKAGQTVLDPNDKKPIGRISRVANSPQLATGMYQGFIQVSDTKKIKDQSVQTVDVVLKSLKEAMSVPIESVVYDKEKSFLWLSENGVAVRKPIELGVAGQGRVEVTRGLQRGDLIVTNGQKFLKSGLKLRVQECESCSNEEVSK